MNSDQRPAHDGGNPNWENGEDFTSSGGFDVQLSPVERETLAAERLLDAGRPADAEKRLLRALSADPGDPVLHRLLARAYLEQDRVEEAESAAREGLRHDPDSAPGHLMLGLILGELGRNPEAEEHYLDCLRIDPVLPLAHLSYAGLMVRTGHLNKAERLARRALALDPELADAHQLLTAIKTEERKLRQASAESAKSVQLAPDDAWSHYSLGVAAYGSCHPFRARRHFREALAMDPSNEDFEESFLESDRSCRWIGLPFYFFSRFLEFVPGAHMGLWFTLVGGYYLADALGYGSHPLVIGLFVSYGLLCLYSLVSIPLTRVWVKLVPPR